MTSQPPPSKISRASVERAVTALLKWNSDKSNSRNPQLQSSDDFLYLVLTLTKIPPKSHVNAYRIPLPNPLYTPENSEICLFVADKNSNSVNSTIDTENLPVSEVIKVGKLKKDYKSYEQKQKLCDSFDLFLAEKKIVPILPNVIGKGFYKKKKIPIAVELWKGNLGEQIERVCTSGMLYLSSGTCSGVRVGRSSMGKREIVDNVAAAMEGIANVVPKKWRNVGCFHLKFSESLALPVYQKVAERGLRIGGVREEKATMEDGFGADSEGEDVVDENKVVGKKRKTGDVGKKKDSSLKILKKSKVSV